MSSQMLEDPADTVVLFPAATRYEQHGGGTETTTERRIAFSPEIPGRRSARRAQREIFRDVAQRVDPARAHLVDFASGTRSARDRAVVPFYDGVETLRATGDSVQWGGSRLCDGGVFPTPSGRAAFTPVARPRSMPMRRSTVPRIGSVSARGGGSSSTPSSTPTATRSRATRDALSMAPDDAEALGVVDGAPVVVRSDAGELRRAVHLAALTPGNVQVFFPEGNVLLSGRRRDGSGVPDYNALVSVEAV